MRLISGVGIALLLASTALAQTPTPIQPRKKSEAPAAQSESASRPNVSQGNVNNFIPDYCANTMTVFRGVLTYHPNENGYSIDFKLPRCYTDGKNLVKITRILLVPWDSRDNTYLHLDANQHMKIILNASMIVNIRGVPELVATNFFIDRDY
jgi:hypothetical protein